jgi:hypothetical protein
VDVKWILVNEDIIQERGVAAQGMSTVDHDRLKAGIGCDGQGLTGFL